MHGEACLFCACKGIYTGTDTTERFYLLFFNCFYMIFGETTYCGVSGLVFMEKQTYILCQDSSFMEVDLYCWCLNLYFVNIDLYVVSELILCKN